MVCSLVVNRYLLECAVIRQNQFVFFLISYPTELKSPVIKIIVVVCNCATFYTPKNSYMPKTLCTIKFFSVAHVID